MLLYRLFLILTVLLLGAAAVVTGSMSPPVGAVVLLLCLWGAGKRRRRRSTTLGSARWAEVDDLRWAGMLSGSSGLILGRTAYGRRDPRQAIKDLIDPRIDAETACRHFVELFHRPKLELVRLSNTVHTAFFAPTGVGKGVSCVIPFLLTTNEACFVLDVKDGELARITAEARRKMGRKVHIIDPYHCVTDEPATLNPVEFIDKSSRFALDDARDMSAEIIHRAEEKGGENSTHFLDNAEAAIAAVIATVVEFAESDQKSLQSVCDITSSPKKWEMAVELMIASSVQQGMLSRLGKSLTHLRDRELASTMTTIARFLRFLSTPAIAASTKESSFDPKEILDGKTDVYCVLPADRVATLSPLLRLWAGTFLRTALRSNGKTKIHFICDEAGSSLGKMDELATALTVGRSAGIRLQLYYQDLGQLKKCWPDGADQTLLANVTQVFFGVNDQQTAEYVSSRLGDETITVNSGGTGGGKSFQTPAMGQTSVTRSYSWNEGWQEQARRLLKPEEVANLSPRTAITFTPGMPPIWTTLVRYWEHSLEPPATRWIQSSSKSKLAADCVALLLAAIGALGGALIARDQYVKQILRSRDSQPRVNRPYRTPTGVPGHPQPMVNPFGVPTGTPGNPRPMVNPFDVPIRPPGNQRPMNPFGRPRWLPGNPRPMNPFGRPRWLPDDSQTMQEQQSRPYRLPRGSQSMKGWRNYGNAR